MTYDLIIIGAGPAGLTAALYAARRQMKTLVISKDLGGQAALTDKIYNYPGIKFAAGLPLMQLFKEQAAEYGAEFLFQEAVGLTVANDLFTVSTSKEIFTAKAVILAFGLTPKDLGVPGETVFKGDSVFCAVTEHGPRFAGQDVAVVGGGNSAFDSVVYLQPIARKIYLIHRRDRFRGEEVTLAKIQAFENVDMVLNSEVVELQGKKTLTGVVIKDVQTGVTREIPLSAVCVNIGYAAQTQWVGEFVERDGRGHIIATDDMTTKTPGLFAAGDCTISPYKQIITSGGEGCKAALKAYEYLQAKEGKRAVMIDWS
ncbi:MAG: FAD-dependent oxidoreductase [Parcubacteria group bacterium]|nr:FAD-dependent oxidoreductase [Parcubacteria group bacterium]